MFQDGNEFFYDSNHLTEASRFFHSSATTQWIIQADVIPDFSTVELWAWIKLRRRVPHPQLPIPSPNA